MIMFRGFGLSRLSVTRFRNFLRLHRLRGGEWRIRKMVWPDGLALLAAPGWNNRVGRQQPADDRYGDDRHGKCKLHTGHRVLVDKHSDTSEPDAAATPL